MSRNPCLESVALLTALVLVVGTSAPPAARAQSTKRTSVVGLLATSAGSAPLIDAFRQSLRDGGWVEDDTLRLEVRYSEGRAERFPERSGKVVRLRSERIVTGSSQATKAAMEATATIPIVFVNVADPIGAGFVRSLARPGGHVTGVTNQFSDLPGKILQLAREVAPRLRHVGILWNPNDPGSALGFKR